MLGGAPPASPPRPGVQLCQAGSAHSSMFPGSPSRGRDVSCSMVLPRVPRTRATVHHPARWRVGEGHARPDPLLSERWASLQFHPRLAGCFLPTKEAAGAGAAGGAAARGVRVSCLLVAVCASLWGSTGVPAGVGSVCRGHRQPRRLRVCACLQVGLCRSARPCVGVCVGVCGGLWFCMSLPVPMKRGDRHLL